MSNQEPAWKASDSSAEMDASRSANQQPYGPQSTGSRVLPPPSSLGAAGGPPNAGPPTGGKSYYPQLPSISDIGNAAGNNNRGSAGAAAPHGYKIPPISGPAPPSLTSQTTTSSPPSATTPSVSVNAPSEQQESGSLAGTNTAQQIASAAYRPLNVKDALSYLDQVKIQFQNHPDVYNHFLDIMKDFKAQTINTPGVIDRVSSLFKGHPSLIQGFNTFLPPGFRIECSLDPSDPNPIRVTTPMGTTTGSGGELASSVKENKPQMSAMGGNMPKQTGGYSVDNRWTAGQYPGEQSQAGPMGVQQGQEYGYSSAIHQDENIGGGTMSQLHAAANGNRLNSADQKRQGGPVEFNHAINYVNKIKNRFSSQPEIYKSFLEILQTYQREQLRIGEVYTQVSLLFKDAPDLLDDFKQFLPESQIGRPELMSGLGGGPQEQVHLPPVGNFAPPGGPGREKKKRSSMGNGTAPTPAELYHHPGSAQYAMDNIQMSSVRGGAGPLGNGIVTGGSTKSIRREPTPSLIPAGPEALPPPSRISNNYEEITFFDKVKKFLGNKQLYNEFLKLMNLFSQRIIDKNTLVERTEMFIGQNKELMDWFKRFVQYEGKPLSIENIPFRKHLVAMALCRSYGPSYRLLPKRDRWMPCSGRDEMCMEVLNDEWIVHPTWASEDSGVVAHKKNQYEEILYRIEEERHEYDYYIESNLRAIQTLEAIANRIANMTAEERAVFKLPPGLGHTSTIYQKVIRKIYDSERGQEVINALHDNPAVAVPIVLRRMKQKDEEWRRAHREWNKVWRETEQKVFFKSLDHVGLTFKQTDKKMLTTRSLISEITVVKAEQTSKRKAPTAPPPKDQLVYEVTDHSVLFDTVSLLATYLEGGSSAFSAADKEKILSSYKSLVCLVFSIPEQELKERFSVADEEKNGDADINGETGESSSSQVIGKKRNREVNGDLLRDVLRRTRMKVNEDEDSTNDGYSTAVEPSKSVEDSVKLFEKESNSKWLKHANGASNKLLQEKVSNDGSVARHKFSMFANTTIYALLRYIQILYDRLKEVKGYESIASKEIKSARCIQFAKDLDLYDRKLEDMGLFFKPEHVYEQTLKICESLVTGDLEHQWYEEALRQAYRNRAYRLYTVDKVVQAIAKHVHLMISDQKSADTMLLYENYRSKPTDSLREKIVYRMQVRSIVGIDENMFRIAWDEKKHELSFSFLGLYALTLKDIKTQEDQWNYYLTSYMMSVPTEGVPLDRIKPPLLTRNLTAPEDGEEAAAAPFVIVDQELVARVCMNTYKLFFEAGTLDFFTRPADSWTRTRTDKALTQRKARFSSFWDGPDGWTSELDEEEIKQSKEGYELWLKEGPVAYTTWRKARESEADKIEEDNESAENQTDEPEQVQVDTEMISEREHKSPSSTGSYDEKRMNESKGETTYSDVRPEESKSDVQMSETVEESTEDQN